MIIISSDLYEHLLSEYGSSYYCMNLTWKSKNGLIEEINIIDSISLRPDQGGGSKYPEDPENEE